MFKADNDTIAILSLGIVAILAVYLKQEQIAIASLGALGGYIGGKIQK